MSDTLFKTEFGQFDLRPSNFHPKSPLRAWNAADELLLNHLKQHCPVEFPRILVVNDACGALAVSLHHYEPESWGDYYTGTQSLQLNLQRNQIESDRVDVLSSIDSLSGTYDVVLLQLPKTLSLLAFQLAHLRQHVRSDTLIVAGGMVKHMTPSMSELFEQYIGPVQASLAEKKARLLFCQLDETLEPEFPEATVYGVPDSPLQLVSHANVFSQQKLDIGTRFLLEHFPDTTKARRIVDLGCGNGALGLYAGWRNPAAELYFIDDSFLAVHSAEVSFLNNPLQNAAHFMPGDALDGFDDEVDLILCNPPFHEGNKVHTQIALKMFSGASRCLRNDGQFWVVGNRHLGYHLSLKRYFRHVDVAAGNSKFVVWACREPSGDR